MKRKRSHQLQNLTKDWGGFGRPFHIGTL